MSNIKLGKYEDAAPLLEIIFYIREKMVTICHVSVLECLIELVACLAQVEVLFTIFCLVSKFKIIKMVNQNNDVVCHFNNGKIVVLHYYYVSLKTPFRSTNIKYLIFPKILSLRLQSEFEEA